MFINVSSQDQNTDLSLSSSNFVVLFPLTINNVNKIELISVTLPNTIYKIHSNNNNNNFIWTNTESTMFLLIIPNKAYNIYNLLSFIQNSMNSLDSGYNYLPTYSNSTFKVTISANSNFTLNFENNTCYKEL